MSTNSAAVNCGPPIWISAYKQSSCCKPSSKLSDSNSVSTITSVSIVDENNSLEELTKSAAPNPF